MNKIAEAVNVINQNFSEAVQKKDNGAFSKLSVMLSEFDDGLREFIQETTRPQIQQVIAKLQSGQNLTPEDLSVARLWLVGDAEYYVKAQKDLSQAHEDLGKVMAKINELKASALDVASACSLRGLLLDAMRTTGAITFYLQQKERVEKFSSLGQDLDEEDRLMMTQILLSKIKSDKY